MTMHKGREVTRLGAEGTVYCTVKRFTMARDVTDSA